MRRAVIALWIAAAATILLIRMDAEVAGWPSAFAGVAG